MLLRGIGVNTKVVFSITTTVPNASLGRLRETVDVVSSCVGT